MDFTIPHRDGQMDTKDAHLPEFHRAVNTSVSKAIVMVLLHS